MELLICPEPGRELFSVRLWTVSPRGKHVDIWCAPVLSWLSYSRLLEAAQILDEAILGQIDACIARGESVQHHLPEAPENFAGIPFERRLEFPKSRKIVRLGVGFPLSAQPLAAGS